MYSTILRCVQYIFLRRSLLGFILWDSEGTLLGMFFLPFLFLLAAGSGYSLLALFRRWRVLRRGDSSSDALNDESDADCDGYESCFSCLPGALLKLVVSIRFSTLALHFSKETFFITFPERAFNNMSNCVNRSEFLVSTMSEDLWWIPSVGASSRKRQKEVLTRVLAAW